MTAPAGPSRTIDVSVADLDLTDPIEPFDVCGPLPTGTTVLEASAGTGKTHAIGASRHPVRRRGGGPLDELLVITFGRAASQELRERVRGHLVLAERALADPATARAGDDPVHALLADGVRRAGRGCGGSGCAARWPDSTRRRSSPPTSSASTC